MREMRPGDHILIAQGMLDQLGDPEKVNTQVSHAQRNLALAEAARAHLDMARFKLDFPELTHGVFERARMAEIIQVQGKD